MKKKKGLVLSVKYLVLSVLIPSMVCFSAIALAATNFLPIERTEGNKASTISPVVSGEGGAAEVIVPDVFVPELEEKDPYVPFLPELKDDSPFIDMENPRDYSTQYDYTNAVLSSKYGTCTVDNGVYTATTSKSIYADMSASTPFPYGTLSADVMANGSDSGLVFGLSANTNTFWEANGVSYYFLFISQSGNLHLGRTLNGSWSSLCYYDIGGFSATATYNVKVVYRVEKIVMFLDDVPVLSFLASEPLTGTGWGIRTGVAGAQISNVLVSSKVVMD